MQFALIFILLLSFVSGLGLLARRLNIPYPILFVIGGLIISFVPILPHQLELDPEVIFFLFLPPLLYIQAFFTSWRDFRYYLRPILVLAIGLVIVTTVAVAYAAHWLIPGLPLAAGFALGAIVSPPDAVAASAIAQRLGLPRRVVTVLEGESLVNDATSLVIFKVSLAAIGATTSFIGKVWIPGEFIYVAVGGIAVGLVIGKVAGYVRRRISNAGPQIFLTFSLMTPYLSYLLADQFLHVSGVLAVVATGLYLGWEAPEATNAVTRLQAGAVWQMILYFLNGIIFVLIGLQLPSILQGIRGNWWPWTVVYAAAICGVCIGVRLLWIFPAVYVPRIIKRWRIREETPDWRHVTIIGWAGMRGIVTLAAAAALDGYPNFPLPHLVQFIAFCVVLVTLVFQGLTLPAVIRFLNVADDGSSEHEETEARNRISVAVFDKLTAIRAEGKVPPSALDVVESFYRERALILEDELAEQLGWSSRRHHVLSVRRLNKIAIAAQRRALLQLRREERIGDDVMHKIEHELDLEEERLMG